MDDSSRLPEWMFDQVEAAVSRSPGSEGLPGVSLRVSRTSDDGLPTFMFLDKAKRLRDALDAAIRAAEAGDFGEPPFSSSFTMDT